MLQIQKSVIALSFISILLLSCAPTMKDFSKINNDLTSSNINTRTLAAQQMGHIDNPEQIVFETLLNCANNDSSNIVRSTCIKSYFRSVPLEKSRQQEILNKLRNYMNSAGCREKKELYYIVSTKLPNETKNEFERNYGNCIHATKFCEYCEQPAVGWCTMRHKWVCEQHRYFQQGGTNWRCP